jgi:hypothetical protein
MSLQFRYAPGLLLVAALASLLSVVSARGDELADKGRAIYKEHQHAVVTVQIVLKSKFSMPGRGEQSSENRQSATGTVLDPSGLTVLSLSVIDPSQTIQNIMAGQDSRFKMETELSDLKLLLDDGTEVPAEVVLRDNDLDLAFLRPKTPLATPLPALDLTKAGKADILDQVLTLNRMGQAVGRCYAASFEHISAVVQRPRLFYVPDSSMTSTTLGSPAFTLDGKVLGLFVLRAPKGGHSAGGSQSDNVASIIVPADDVLKAAKQAPAVAESKTEKPAKETPKPDEQEKK